MYSCALILQHVELCYIPSQDVIESARTNKKKRGGGGGGAVSLLYFRSRPLTRDLRIVNNMHFMCSRSQTRLQNRGELCNLDVNKLRSSEDLKKCRYGSESPNCIFSSFHLLRFIFSDIIARLQLGITTL